MEEIGKIKLKPAKDKLVDRSDPNPKKTMQEFQDSKQKATYTNVEKWYDTLKEHVVPAFLFTFENDEAEAVIANYEHLKLKQKNRVLTEHELKLLDNLAQKIDKCVAENIPTGNTQGFFIRISTRSAKDGMMFHEKTKNAIKQKIEELKIKNNVETVTDNDKLSIIFSQFIQQLVVKSGKEAVELMSNSHRIWQDLVAYREVRGSQSEMSIILRPWTYIPAWGEFRGFVFNRKLVAISSYNRAVYFPFVNEMKSTIEQKIKSYFQIIEPKVIPELKNFICDFAFLDDNLEQMIIVELNQYRDYEGNATNAELFDWVKDEKILSGEAPFEFRILEKPLEHETLMKTITAPLKVHLGYMNENDYDYEKDHL